MGPAETESLGQGVERKVLREAGGLPGRSTLIPRVRSHASWTGAAAGWVGAMVLVLLEEREGTSPSSGQVSAGMGIHKTFLGSP